MRENSSSRTGGVCTSTRSRRSFSSGSRSPQRANQQVSSLNGTLRKSHAALTSCRCTASVARFAKSSSVVCSGVSHNMVMYSADCYSNALCYITYITMLMRGSTSETTRPESLSQLAPVEQRLKDELNWIRNEAQDKLMEIAKQVAGKIKSPSNASQRQCFFLCCRNQFYQITNLVDIHLRVTCDTVSEQNKKTMSRRHQPLVTATNRCSQRG